MNNYFYTIEPCKHPVINIEKLEILYSNYGKALNPYLIYAQEILEIEYGHLFSSRTIEFEWVFTEQIVQLPIKFIKEIIEVKIKSNEDYKNFSKDKVKIINENTIEIDHSQKNITMIIKYISYGLINGKIEWHIIEKAISLFNFIR